MQFFNRYKYEIFLAIILIAFTAFKWSDLFLPYFWDELAYYAKAGLYMHDNGLGLLPSSLPPELSRGHPLLFQFLTGLWFKVFGTSLFAGHSFALTISLLALISTYKLTSVFIERTYSLLAVGILAVQPVFLTQSVLILPEVSILLFSNLALYYYFKYENTKYIIASVLLVFIRETAVIIPICLLGIDLIKSKKANSTIKHLIPILVLGVFFIIQKIQNGWFFFPFHVNIMAISKGDMVSNIFRSIYFVFIAQFRFCTSIFLVFFLFLIFKKEKFKAFQIDFIKTSLIILIASILAFSSLFVMNRYFIYLFPLLIISSVISIQNLIEKNKFFIMACIIPFLSILKIQNQEKFNIDVDYGYKNSIKASNKLANYVNQLEINDKKIYCHPSLSKLFSDGRLGYFSNNIFSITENKDKNIDYAIDINPNGWNRDFSYWNELKLAKTIKESNFEILIFKK